VSAALPPDATPGETQVDVDGATYRLGDKVVLRLGERSDPYDKMLDGRVATLERITSTTTTGSTSASRSTTTPASSSCARPGASSSSS
jgi:hypothetical protein